MIFSPGDRVLVILGEDVEAGEVITTSPGWEPDQTSYTIMADDGRALVEIPDLAVHPERGVGPRPEPLRPPDYPPCE